MAEIVVIILILSIRILVPLTILRWPFWGMVASIFCDTFDLTLLKLFGWDSFGFAGYQLTDKLLDLYYLSFGLFVSAKIENVFVQRTLQALYFWRFAGVILFEITGLRWILFAAPNIFENLYLLVFGSKELFNLRLSKKLVIILLLVAALFKLPQEYVMHYKEYRWGFGNFFDGLGEIFEP